MTDTEIKEETLLEKEKNVSPDKRKEIDETGESPNPFEGMGLGRYWGVAQLIGFHKMSSTERKILRWVVIAFIIYVLFPDDVIQWIFILFDWKFL